MARKFPLIFTEKIKTRICNCPAIKRLIRDPQFSSSMNAINSNAWCSFFLKSLDRISWKPIFYHHNKFLIANWAYTITISITTSGNNHSWYSLFQFSHFLVYSWILSFQFSRSLLSGFYDFSFIVVCD